jgi:hypothetical protein
LKVFLSYARTDSAVAREVAEALIDAGHQTWVDTEELRGGEDWQDVIVDRLTATDVVVVLISSASINSNNVRAEVRLAAQAAKTLIPVKIEETKIDGSLAYQLGGLHHIDLFADREAGLNQLVKSVNPRGPIHDRPDPAPTQANSDQRWWQRHLLPTAGVGLLALIVIATTAVIALSGDGDTNGGADGGADEGVATPSTASDDVGQFCASAQNGDRPLTGRDLWRCNLDGADLSGLDLTSTNLSEASLRGANLSGALIATATLVGADLTDAIVDGAHLYRVELEGAIGLDSIDWSGALVERSVCDGGPCVFDGAITINRSAETCSAEDFARGAPIAEAAMNKSILWIDDDGDCLHDDWERANGPLLNDRDSNDDGRPDGVDGHGGSEMPLSLYVQIDRLG